MKNKKTAAILLALALAFSAAGCGASKGPSALSALSEGPEQTVSAQQNVSEGQSELSEIFSSRDLSGETGDYVTVTLSGDGATADGALIESSGGVVTISAAGNYLLTGSLEGRVEICVGEEEKVQLILSDAHISSDGAAAICVVNADKVFLTLAEGTQNSVESTGELAAIGEVKADGAIFAKCDLTINGTGSLSVKCETGHGVVSKDDLKIASGTLSVTSAKQGLSGKDSVSVADGVITISAGTDGIHSENDNADKGMVNILGGTIDISSGSDGIDATGNVTVSGGTLRLSGGDDGVHADAALTVSGGSVTISRSYEGLEAVDIVISGGTIDVTASDDGLNAAGGNDGSGWGGAWGRGDPFSAQDVSITISGGELHINAQGDGIDSNGDLTVTGGTILVSGPTNGGNGAIDYNGSGTISGGTLIAAGASGMAENFSNASTQPSMLVSFSGTVSGGSEICVYDASGRFLRGLRRSAGGL